MRRHITLALFFNAALTACSQFPQLDDTVSTSARNAAYPDLVPVENIQNQVPEARIEATDAMDATARAARLKARAARLKGAILDDATRQRMDAGVQ